VKPADAARVVEAIDVAVAALNTLRDALVEASAAPPVDDWISHREPHALSKHARCKLCRELKAKGDSRAAIVGRDHLLRRSAIDEYLHGKPAPARAALQRVDTSSDGGEIERRLDEIFAGVLIPGTIMRPTR